MKRLLVIISLLLCIKISYGQDRFLNFTELQDYLNTIRFDGSQDKVQVIKLRNAVFGKIQQFLRSIGISVDYCSDIGYFLQFYKNGNKLYSARLEFDWVDNMGANPGNVAKQVKTIKLICYPKGYSSISIPKLFFDDFSPVNYDMYVYLGGNWRKQYSDYLYKTKKERVIAEYYPLSGILKRLIRLTEEGKYTISEYDTKGKLIIQDTGHSYGYDSRPTDNILSSLKIVDDDDSKRKSSNENNSAFIDLGLPSGTLWKGFAEDGLYDYDTALHLFGNSLPSYEQFVELKDYCTWTWNGSGYTVKGKNGNSIKLEAAGWRDEKGRVTLVGTDGGYWTSRAKGSVDAWYLNFTTSKVRMLSYHRNVGLSVLLIK
ncbi:MAG: hypothetical protein J6T04_00670 [Bacteroidales bacterium]|nr:hypothetical protein [Bacteroidales bacterium]